MVVLSFETSQFENDVELISDAVGEEDTIENRKIEVAWTLHLNDDPTGINEYLQVMIQSVTWEYGVEGPIQDHDLIAPYEQVNHSIGAQSSGGWKIVVDKVSDPWTDGLRPTSILIDEVEALIQVTF